MSAEVKPETPTSAFPSGNSRPVAVLADEPPELARRFRLHFAEGLDDLDRFDFAVLNLDGNHKAWLYKHHGDPNPGTVVRVDAAIDPAVGRRELTARLSLTPEDVLWWSPEA